MFTFNDTIKNVNILNVKTYVKQISYLIWTKKSSLGD